MPASAAEIDERLSQSVREVGQKIERHGEKLAGIESSLGWVTKIGAFFVTMLLLVFSAIASLSWNASALNSEVKQQGARLDKIDQKLDLIIQQTAQIVAAKKS
jgi:tetrahydromethanopterin S-methyltransferase subunit G